MSTLGLLGTRHIQTWQIAQTKKVKYIEILLKKI